MAVNRFLQVTAFTRLSVKSIPFSSSPATWCIRTTNFESLLFHRLWTLEVIVKTVINSWKSCFWTLFLNLYLEVASLPLHLNLFRLSTFPKFSVWYSLVLNLYAFVAWNKLGIFLSDTLHVGNPNSSILDQFSAGLVGRIESLLNRDEQRCQIETTSKWDSPTLWQPRRRFKDEQQHSSYELGPQRCHRLS